MISVGYLLNLILMLSKQKNNIIKEQEAELTKFIYYSTPS